jgi:GTP cyclohydrolase I|tara:strand:+ start:2204 stop:2890 length:687 start_codon:yes stop_codon:yes gene_type:complete
MAENISKIIKNRIESVSGKYFSNDNISEYIKDDELEKLELEVQEKMQSLLDSLIIDTTNDHNTQNTAKRIAKMYLQETFHGRYLKRPKITSFPNATDYDQIYITGPITIRSTCAHHFQNITGKCYVGVYPGKNVIGLSKFNRLVHWIAERPQIQEEMTMQIADAVEHETKADGIAVVIKAQHHCITHRGIKEHDSDMTTSIVRGTMRDEESQKREFFTLLKSMKGFND